MLDPLNRWGHLRNLQSSLVLVLASLVACPSYSSGQDSTPTTISIADNVTLHYVERGSGEAVVFIHGLMDDYSSWLRQLDGFAKEGYRAMAYSRRHNYPNRNQIRPNHSASLEADDLAAFVRELKLSKVHVVGYSYGAYTALFFAIKYPSLASTVTLAEPPIAPWLSDLQHDPTGSGPKQWAKLMGRGIEPARKALESGDDELAIRSMINAIGGDEKYEQLPDFVKAKCLRNIQELRALVKSPNRYPNVDRAQVRRLTVPTLIVSGSESVATAKFTDPELERLIQKDLRKRVVFKGATHAMWIEQPVRFRNEILDFIRSNSAK